MVIAAPVACARSRASVAAVLLHMALVVLTVLVAAAFWETHRLTAVGAIAALYLACGIAALAAFLRQAAAAPAPFAATRGELERDLAQMRAPR
jgi:uncharacterized membrane protein YqjE